MAAPRITRTLESMTATSLNRLHGTTTDTHPIPPSKKRKTTHDSSTLSPIRIRAHFASLADEPYILDPLTVLPRSRVPFSWVDSSALSVIKPGSLFVSNIPVLEKSERGTNVLVARLGADNGLYVVERARRGVYAVSKLGRTVGEGDVFVAGKGSASGIWGEGGVGTGEAGEGKEGEWWEVARVEDPENMNLDFQSGGSKEKWRADVKVVFGKGDRPPERRGVAALDQNLSSSSDGNLNMDVDVLTPLESEGRAGGDVGEDSLQSGQELLDTLREQYLQALYVSKTSVAYFAKGPLTRCRTAFRSDEESKRPADLVGFYRNAIFNTKKMDLKYRETLPATIRDVVIAVSEDESAPRKKRKSKKKTIGRNGLYPEEDEFIRKWWKDRSLAENGLLMETSREAETKKHVGDLRLRETQLQILLILETIALEMAAGEKRTEANEKADETPKPRSKKSQDLNVLLELHLDRLCIWHAVSAEETTIPDSVKQGGHLSGKKVESDAVRDFCTEVIIPFYSSRLPDKCKLITRKFGVSSASSPQKQTQKKAPRPGSSVKREQPQKSRRSLHRVLTDEQATSRARPSLPRSNTTPAYPDAKRESMDLLPMLSSNVRGGIQKAKRVENREVDLNAAARQHETKLKKVQILVDQKKELDAAIHALRKPNRELVAKDIAEDADKRVGGSSRKQKNPVRNPMGQGVQVMATPKGSRKKDMVVGLPPPKNLVRTASSHDSPEDNAQYVPASAIRPRSFPAPPSRIPGSDTNQDGAVQETPFRRPQLAASVDQSAIASGNLFRVPDRPRSDIAPSTPVSSRRINAQHSQSRPAVNTSTVMETPPKQTQPQPPKPPDAVAGSPAMRTPVRVDPTPVTPEKSIYEQLGWDDDDELAL